MAAAIVWTGMMAKKRSSAKLATGTRIRVKAGIAIPEFSDILCEGWTGVVENLIGKSNPSPKYVIEWDQATIDNMPAEYLAKCEKNNLFHRMACFTRSEIDVVAD